MTRKDFIIVADALLEVKTQHIEKTCSNFNKGYFLKYLNTKKK